METLCYSLAYSVKETAEGGMAAIIVSAGSSSRMNGMDKQFLPLLGIPVIVRSILAFEHCDCIASIIVVVKESDILEVQNLIEQYHIKKVTDIVKGGASRAESVQNGMARIDDKTGYVMIHDGARPLISHTVMERVAAGVIKHGAAAPAVPLKDTIKQIEVDGKIIATPKRDDLVLVQTPQAFAVGLYREALTTAGEELFKFTDDCAIVEHAGHSVYTVEGDYKNIKITTPEDLLVAECFLRLEEV